MSLIEKFNPQIVGSNMQYIITANYLCTFNFNFLEKLAINNGLRSGFKYSIFYIDIIINRLNGNFDLVSKKHLILMLKHKRIKFKYNEEREVLIERVKTAYVNYYAFGFDISLILNSNNDLTQIYTHNIFLLNKFNEKINEDIKYNKKLKNLCNL